MAFVTEEQLSKERSILTDAFVKLAKSLSEESDLFLSHSKHDSRHVDAAVTLLRRAGARVYVDTLDSELRLMNAEEKSNHLRQAIKNCRRLVVLFTQNTA